MKHRSSARELTAVSGGIGNLTGARNRQSDQPRSSTGEKGIGILLPPSFEILEPGRLSISGETERAEGGYGVPRWVRAPKRFFKG